jgi:hypothetical protein
MTSEDAMDFFEKVKEGFDKGFKTVSVRSKEMVDATRISSQVASLRDEKRGALEELGRIAYAMFNGAESADPKIRETCESITALEARITEKERQLEAIHRTADQALVQGRAEAPPATPAVAAKCACGATLREDAKFCPVCGQPVPPTPPPA